MFHNIQQSLFSSASSAWAIHVGSTRRLARQEGATLTTFIIDEERGWHGALVRGRRDQQQQQQQSPTASQAA
jgi:hypothetical protein